MKRAEAIEWLKCINTKKFGWDEYAMQESQIEIRERCEQHVREALDMAIEALQAEDEQGEWINQGDDALCSKCGGSSGIQFDGVEPIPRTTTYCPHCGVRMKVGEE